MAKDTWGLRGWSLGAGLLSLLASAGCQRGGSGEDGGGSQGAAPAAPLLNPSPALIVPKTRLNPGLLRRFNVTRHTIDAPSGKAPAALVELGRWLYYDPRLSKSQDFSCNHCHQLDRYGVDGEATSRGHNGLPGRRNAPTVYHAAGHVAQFWDGRSANVEKQALDPILNPAEMGAPSAEHVVRVLRGIPAYVVAFDKAFPKETAALTFENVGVAIGAFERGLVTHSRWDDYLEGKTQALSRAEVDGLKAFIQAGCLECHTGEFLGGSSYHVIGVAQPWPNQEDKGRYEVTFEDADLMSFKVPTLRNVAETAPYFHDGSAASLRDAVLMMGKHQVGIALSDQEVTAIVTWLGALTGELPTRYISRPVLP